MGGKFGTNSHDSPGYAINFKGKIMERISDSTHPSIVSNKSDTFIIKSLIKKIKKPIPYRLIISLPFNLTNSIIIPILNTVS